MLHIKAFLQTCIFSIGIALLALVFARVFCTLPQGLQPTFCGYTTFCFAPIKAEGRRETKCGAAQAGTPAQRMSRCCTQLWRIL